MSKFNSQVFFGIACIMLFAISIGLYLKGDHKAPVIQFNDADIVYTEGEDTKDLLTNLRAEDNHDGDVTDRVFVVSVTPNNDKSKAVVLYGVSDKAKNAATAARTVTYQVSGGETAATPDTTGAKDHQPGDDSENNSAQTANQTSDDDHSNQTQNSEQQENTQAPSDGAVRSESTNAAAPTVTLSSSRVEIKTGSRFNPVGVITSISDDKDDQNSLFRRVSVSGEYDVKKAGTYPIQITVTDSDGNTSAPVSFQLVVK